MAIARAAMTSGVAIAQDRRSAILVDALAGLAEGLSTDAIAAKHGIAGQTLRVWLLNEPEAERARAIYLAGEVSAAFDAQKQARRDGDHESARSAAAEFKSASWLAERRLSQLYGAKSEVNTGVSISVSINRGPDTTYSVDNSRAQVSHDADAQVIDYIGSYA